MISLRQPIDKALGTLAETVCSANRAVPRNFTEAKQPIELQMVVTGMVWNHF